MDVYFTRQPAYPDGFSWIEMLQNEDSVGCHIALTPTWNETAFFADYVLPMGHASDNILPLFLLKLVWFTHEVQVWEEDEFWMASTMAPWESEHFMSPYSPSTTTSTCSSPEMRLRRRRALTLLVNEEARCFQIDQQARAGRLADPKRQAGDILQEHGGVLPRALSTG